MLTTVRELASGVIRGAVIDPLALVFPDFFQSSTNKEITVADFFWIIKGKCKLFSFGIRHSVSKCKLDCWNVSAVLFDQTKLE